MNDKPVQNRNMILLIGVAIVATVVGGFLWMDYRENKRIRARETEEIRKRNERMFVGILEMAKEEREEREKRKRRSELRMSCIKDRLKILCEIDSLD
ncbi:MAG: hypothetical protein KAY37_01490 [Phycisphaerae bacterium]|nr:hypothetical protein [Phycisphaerae bacterium]